MSEKKYKGGRGGRMDGWRGGRSGSAMVIGRTCDGPVRVQTYPFRTCCDLLRRCPLLLLRVFSSHMQCHRLCKSDHRQSGIKKMLQNILAERVANCKVKLPAGQARG